MTDDLAWRAAEWPTRPLLIGWVVGVVLTLLLRSLGTFLPDGCRGHTLLALAGPLLMGPGGLALAAAFWKKRPVAMLALGLVGASLVPSLLISSYDIGQLRNVGCAGGYVMLSAEEGGKQISDIALSGGERLVLHGRLGGYTRENHPEAFFLNTLSPSEDIRVEAPSEVHAGDDFAVILLVKEGAALNRHEVIIEARSAPDLQRQSNNNAAGAMLRFGVTITPEKK